MDMFGRIVVHIQNLNPEVSLQSMLIGLPPGKFTDSLWKKKPSSRDELHERAKDYIQNGRDIQVQKRSPTNWTKAKRERRRYQAQLTQVGQKAQDGQASTSPKRAQVRALHTSDGQLHYNP